MRLEVGEAISYGWNKFSQHWQQFVVLVLVVFVALLAVGLIANLLLLPAVTGDDPNTFLALIGAALAFGVTFVVGFLVQAGVYRAGLGATQGRPPSLSMLTDSTNIGAYALTVIVVGLVAMLGYILCVIPGLIWIFFTAFAPLRALEKGEGPGDAIRGSIEMVRSDVGQVLLVLVVSYLVYAVGAVFCGVGLLVSIPVALVAICYSYRVLLQEPITP